MLLALAIVANGSLSDLAGVAESVDAPDSKGYYASCLFERLAGRRMQLKGAGSSEDLRGERTVFSVRVWRNW